nr:DUF4411 family protein [uncultured Allomuricauda sp.]
MNFLIDANILIHAHRTTHPLDIHVTFWEKLIEVLDRLDVMSIDKVKSEIYHYEDDLCVWCKENIKKAFWKDSTTSMNHYSEIQNWANSQNFYPNALREFADVRNADPFLVSYALNQIEQGIDITVVTLEVPAPDSKKTIKLPDVCNQFEIPFINNNDLYRLLEISF